MFLWSPKLQKVLTWRAMTTPLASIIGSGFLVLGPILNTAYGRFAPLVMAALCLVAYLYGAAIRYNITAIETHGKGRGRLVNSFETVASWSLGFAYIVSVAYYLNLFGAFGVSLTAVNDPVHAKLLTSAVFGIILIVGWRRGFKALEGMEYVTVTLKLAIIAGLLVGLLVYFYGKASGGHLVFIPAELTGWPAVTLAFGLIVTVQGFETSRYLAADYNSTVRIRSMRWAQWVSTAIYMIYILLLAYVFERQQVSLSETAIIDLMSLVAPILPVLLVAAALAAQFSAAVADTSGSGGLISELTHNRVSPRMAYALLTVIGLILTWSANVFEIISFASRAFAFYYALQAAIAAMTAWRQPDQKKKALFFASLAMLGILIVLFGKAIEA
ncbi:MAG: hypothetical protein JKX71_00280 [Amylibacter sp.]|nr:hypothetical protein [Amylibacter sp.]